MTKLWSILAFAVAALAVVVPSRPALADEPVSFARFDQRARAGERLNVVFFGGSLTWGANSSDPQQTSYRARMARKFEAQYPRAHFKFQDAAIGGTGSQLGVFRFERDVLQHKPDIVFLDFTYNDDPKGTDTDPNAAYEALVRRTVVQAHCPVVQVFFPDAAGARGTNVFPRVEAHRKIAQAYGSGIGDAVSFLRERVASGKADLKELWSDPGDQTHPTDKGYEAYTDAVWAGYQDAVTKRLVCKAPAAMLYPATYMTSARVPLTSLAALPAGWEKGRPNRTSAWYDMLMSRWLDDEVVVQAKAQPLRVTFRGATAMLYGEGTMKSGKYRVTLDGQTKEYDAGWLARPANGNVRHFDLLASGLNPDVEHQLTIEPLLEENQELRFESLCVAGGAATVQLAP